MTAMAKKVTMVVDLVEIFFAIFFGKIRTDHAQNVGDQDISCQKVRILCHIGEVIDGYAGAHEI